MSERCKIVILLSILSQACAAVKGIPVSNICSKTGGGGKPHQRLEEIKEHLTEGSGNQGKDTHPANCNSGPEPPVCVSVLEWFHRGFLSDPGKQKRATESLRWGWVDCVGLRYIDP